jgi:CheY-like chemotaxis protein
MEGLNATAAYDGFSAYDNFKKRSPDIIFSDIGMPGMDGHELARKIRQSPGGDKVCLVALTGWGQESDQVKSKQSGFDFHLTKPVDPATLRSFLKEIPARS